jgi:hypothetical protein
MRDGYCIKWWIVIEWVSSEKTVSSPASSLWIQAKLQSSAWFHEKGMKWKSLIKPQNKRKTSFLPFSSGESAYLISAGTYPNGRKIAWILDKRPLPPILLRFSAWILENHPPRGDVRGTPKFVPIIAWVMDSWLCWSRRSSMRKDSFTPSFHRKRLSRTLRILSKQSVLKHRRDWFQGAHVLAVFLSLQVLEPSEGY